MGLMLQSMFWPTTHQTRGYSCAPSWCLCFAQHFVLQNGCKNAFLQRNAPNGVFPFLHQICILQLPAAPLLRPAACCCLMLWTVLMFPFAAPSCPQHFLNPCEDFGQHIVLVQKQLTAVLQLRKRHQAGSLAYRRRKHKRLS